MAAMKRIPIQPTGYRYVYDTDPDAITRPDTVPAALRVTEVPSSGVEHRPPRELRAYPSVPELSAVQDDPTVVDPPHEHPTTSHASDERFVTNPPDPPLSGPRNRMVSTVPPPRRARRTTDPKSSVVTHRVPTPRAPALGSLPAPRRYAAWQLLLAGSLTTALSIAVGTSLADGSLKRLVESVFSSSKAAELSVTLVPKLHAPVRETLALPSLRSALAADADTVPMTRLEDLPVSEQSEQGTKTKRHPPARRAR